MIPLLHDFSGARILVFGGGPVGARKARRFAREAKVVVVSPTFADREFGDATLEQAAPGPSDVPDWIDRIKPALVVATTDDPEVNAAVEDAARNRGLLVNRADHSGARDPGSVVVPATVRSEPVVAAVSTQGRAPAVSATLRDEVSERLDGAGELATLVGDLRKELADSDIEENRRRDALRTVAESDRVREQLAAGDTERAREVAKDLLTDARDDGPPAGNDEGAP